MAVRIKSLRVRCQFCGSVNRTKNLEMELLCRFCNKWAKYRYQTLILTRVHDLSNHKYLKIYEAVLQEKTTEEIIA